MSENNIKISFSYDIHEMMEIKEYDVWYLKKIKVIIDTRKMRRKKGWVDKLENEIVGDWYGVDSQENQDNVMLDIWDIGYCQFPRISQEECYKLAIEDSTYREYILKKFRIRNYEIIYEFESDKWCIEQDKELIEICKNSLANKEYFDKSEVF